MPSVLRAPGHAIMLRHVGFGDRAGGASDYRVDVVVMIAVVVVLVIVTVVESILYLLPSIRGPSRRLPASRESARVARVVQVP